MKGGATDGHTLGMATTSALTYTPLISKNVGYTADDFDYVITTAPTQMGLAVRADSGWKTMEDLVKASKAGKKLKFSIMTPRLGDAAYLIGKKYGFEYNSVKAKGGRGVLNGLMAKDVDVGFIAGLHVKAVAAGDIVNLLSVESARLKMSPDAPTMKEIGIPYDFGIKFIAFVPKGTNPEAIKTIAAAFSEVLSDPNSKARQFVQRTFGEPPLKTGEILAKQIKQEIADNQAILKTIQ